MNVPLRDYFTLVAGEYIPPAMMAFLVGIVFTSQSLSSTVDLVIGVVSLFFVTIGYNSFNAIYDKKIDLINKPYRPLPMGLFSDTKVLALSLGFFLLSIALGLLINLNFLLINAVAVVLAIIYSHPRLYLKRFFVVGTVIGNLIYAVLFPLAGWSLGQGVVPMGIIFFLFFFGLGTGILKDFEDLEGDVKFRIRTVPHVLGTRDAVYFSISLFVVSLLILFALVLDGTLALSYLVLSLFVLLASFSATSMLRSNSKLVSRQVFLRGMVILVLMEVTLVALKIL